ncbi:hypothetical protein G7054_g3390 [Neopestalotiopsis clavispora]|nr:hypothetical protein G7054_g3390 [Neopestalotiopsis clavispora]
MRAVLRLLPARSNLLYTSTTHLAQTSLKRNVFAQPLRKMSDLTTIIAKDIVPPVGPYIHLDPQGTLTEGTIAEKTALCFKNLEAVLKEAGSSMQKIVKVNIFLADMADFAEMNKEYEKWMVHKPARSCVAVKTLPKNATVEIECIALP